MELAIKLPNYFKPLFEAEFNDSKGLVEATTLEEYTASRIEELLVDEGVHDKLLDSCEDRGIQIDWDND